ncbi:MAG: hypothetical protein LBP29_02145, partial [Treponema sp.]|nr:hypothetical protein [Treponema sp.]
MLKKIRLPELFRPGCAGLAALLLCAACSAPASLPERVPPGSDALSGAPFDKLSGSLPGSLPDSGVSSDEAPEISPEVSAENAESRRADLDELAELERSGGFVPGLGLAESNLREASGDYAGAVLAVYKEL